MSYNKVLKFSHYWSSNPSLGNVTIKNATSRDRCKTLLLKLYFAEPENASKTYYTYEVVSCLKQTFKQFRSESSHKSIDESMAKFKGRSSLKQTCEKRDKNLAAM
ncbi:piggyBac transposable element-derived protein 4 [Nephila pilipes]|uniref:PiggyBac transposable element-derived protein 4 n=1 Tax=Nephila pilipes TaxID=299642 RepID=A0A8X6QFN2_NEPPI|nr:piggyBac transposable element-derived protein 4 [Nephila pilipes]